MIFFLVFGVEGMRIISIYQREKVILIFLNINGFHIIKEGAIENGMGIMNM